MRINYRNYTKKLGYTVALVHFSTDTYFGILHCGKTLSHLNKSENPHSFLTSILDRPAFANSFSKVVRRFIPEKTPFSRNRVALFVGKSKNAKVGKNPWQIQSRIYIHSFTNFFSVYISLYRHGKFILF